MAENIWWFTLSKRAYEIDHTLQQLTDEHDMSFGPLWLSAWTHVSRSLKGKAGLLVESGVILARCRPRCL